MKTYQNFCEVITKQIFNIIDQKGSLLRWHKDWDSEGCAKLPVGSYGIYHGANLFSLFYSQWEQGFKSNKWFTFNQINKHGGRVQKGAKSEEVFFWKIQGNGKGAEVKAQEDDNAKGKENTKETKEIKQKLIFKVYRVFNLEQTTLELNACITNQFQCEALNSLINKLGVTISHFGNRACYSSGSDTIILPNPNPFTSKENYCVTLLHEVSHWVARENRLPREYFKNITMTERHVLKKSSLLKLVPCY